MSSKSGEKTVGRSPRWGVDLFISSSASLCFLFSLFMLSFIIEKVFVERILCCKDLEGGKGSKKRSASNRSTPLFHPKRLFLQLHRLQAGQRELIVALRLQGTAGSLVVEIALLQIVEQ